MFSVPEKAHEGLEGIDGNVIRITYFLYYDNPVPFSVILALEQVRIHRLQPEEGDPQGTLSVSEKFVRKTISGGFVPYEDQARLLWDQVVPNRICRVNVQGVSMISSPWQVRHY